MSLDAALNLMFSPSEKRSSESGTSYISDVFSLFSGSSKGKVNASNYKAALKLSAFYNGVDQISNDIAKIPFGVYQNKDGSRERVKVHPADRLISSEPNAYMTSFVERKLMAVSLLMRGNSLSKIEFDHNGVPQSLTFINWDDVIDIRLHKGDLIYIVRGYQDPLLSSEVLHFKNLSHNGIVGVSVITYAAQQLNLAIEIQSFSATNIENKGVSRGVIEADKQVAAPAKLAIISGVKSALADKSPDRVAVLDEGMKWKAINITPQEAQIIEQSRFSIEDIARWLNIAPHKIKSLQQSTNNNIEQQSLDHVSDTIQPYVTNIEQEYAKKLLTEKERQANFYVIGRMNVLLRADIKSRGEYFSKAVLFGWLTRNEVRELEDQNKGPEMLSEFLTPTNTFTEKQIAKNLKTGNDE